MSTTFTIAVLQQKGGSGKTTLATNLAAAAHLAGERVLLVDLDAQGSAFDWSAARADGSKLAGITVVRADRALALARFREMARGYTTVVFDGPPRLGDVTRSAACAADVAVIPVQPGAFDLWSAGETLALLDAADAIRAELHLRPVRRAFVLNRAPARTLLAREAPAALEASGAELAGVVGQRIAFPEAAGAGESVLTREPSGPAAFEIRRLYKTLTSASKGRKVAA